MKGGRNLGESNFGGGESCGNCGNRGAEAGFQGVFKGQWVPVHRVLTEFLKRCIWKKKARANLQKGLTCWLKCIDFVLKVVGNCLKVYLGFAVAFFFFFRSSCGLSRSFWEMTCRCTMLLCMWVFMKSYGLNDR